MAISSLYEFCRLCGHRCGINRLKGKRGKCGLGPELLISSCTLHHGEEPFISGARGSGTVFLSGCNLKCVYCQNYQISRITAPAVAAVDDSNAVNEYAVKGQAVKGHVDEICSLLSSGAHNLNFVSPTSWIPDILDVLDAVRIQYPDVTAVYNTGGYDNPEYAELLCRHFQVFLPDVKYADSELAERYSGAGNYPEINKCFLKEIFSVHKTFNIEAGIMTRGICIRHLVLPGQIQNTLRVIDYIADTFGDNVYLSLMSQYTPMQIVSVPEELRRPLRAEEYETAVVYAEKAGLENVLIQEMESAEVYTPDFTKSLPFTDGNTIAE